ncbi:GH17163 [Drosophila grimshawi]|uniref:GH17163 n=1 Tax=Drosophila grimshawi TaxID=7222 RepID=B4J178_DROGR|nr:GH17163 [Drosophila grimshawi]
MLPLRWGMLLGVVLLVAYTNGAAIDQSSVDDDAELTPLTELERTKRSGRGYVRGQTQSQYLNFGKPEEDGKAEAEANEGGSRATVSGTHGMGQAQSQFSAGDCGDCSGYQTEYPGAGGMGGSALYPSGTSVDGGASVIPGRIISLPAGAGATAGGLPGYGTQPAVGGQPGIGGGQPGYGTQPGVGGQPGVSGGQPGYGTQPGIGGSRPGHATQPGIGGGQPGYLTPGAGGHPAAGGQPGIGGGQPGYGAQPGAGTQPGVGGAQPGYSTQPGGRPGVGGRPGIGGGQPGWNTTWSWRTAWNWRWSTRIRSTAGSRNSAWSWRAAWILNTAWS